MGDISERKLKIIQWIMLAHDERIIAALENELTKLYKQEPTLVGILKPTAKRLDPEVLKRQQQWKPIDRGVFDSLVEAANIQEPLDELLAQLTP
jgi:hypothetical protein